MTKYGYFVEYPENLILRTNVDIGVFTHINSHFGVKIQDGVEIGLEDNKIIKNENSNTPDKLFSVSWIFP